MREIYHSDVITAAIASKYNKRDVLTYTVYKRYVTRKIFTKGNLLIEHIHDASNEDRILTQIAKKWV